VAKNKLKSFLLLEGFEHVHQPTFKDIVDKDYYLKGKWAKEFFKNNNPIVLELGCGKGEYSTGLAELHPEFNFIGMDIKGARICKGAKTVVERNLKNVAFIRSSIEPIQSFFSENEISEIWLTFSDPQPNKPKKRLSSSIFLNKYLGFLKNGGIIHLKTDSLLLFEYTLSVVIKNNLKIFNYCKNIYAVNSLPFAVCNIQTFYEKKFIGMEKKISYLEFTLDKGKILIEPEDYGRNIISNFENTFEISPISHQL
jgi:tRNA (guanine-N7-)-methyltransferase